MGGEEFGAVVDVGPDLASAVAGDAFQILVDGLVIFLESG
jgi:hypothetical protein